MAGSVNVVVLVGNLTRDPELRATGRRHQRVPACASPSTTASRTATTGEWGDKPNYFDVDVFGAQGERCAQYLAKGRQVAVEGRLRWRAVGDAGRPEALGRQRRRQQRAVHRPARQRRPGGGWSGASAGSAAAPASPAAGLEPAEGDFGESDDDIPF